MDVTKLKRDAARIKSYLRALPDGTLVTTKDLEIHIPARYFEKNLATSGNETYIAGHFVYVDPDGFYAVNQTNAMMRIAPITQYRYNVAGDEYIAYQFPKGATVVENTQLVVNNELPFDVFVNFIDQGNVPWFFTYADLGRLFHNSPHYANFTVGADISVFEIMVATIARDPKDLNVYYRHRIKSEADLESTPAYVPFKSVIFGPRSAFAKLAGNYIDQAIPSALVNPTEKVDNIERYLRS